MALGEKETEMKYALAPQRTGMIEVVGWEKNGKRKVVYPATNMLLALKELQRLEGTSFGNEDRGRSGELGETEV